MSQDSPPLTSADVRAARVVLDDADFETLVAQGVDVSKLPTKEDVLRIIESRPWYEGQMRLPGEQRKNPALDDAGLFGVKGHEPR